MIKREQLMEQEEHATPAAVLHVCLKCDYYGVDSDRYCPLCGSGLVYRCEACHHLLSNPFARYCVHCGQPLKVHESDEPKRG